jgi:transketolase
VLRVGDANDIDLIEHALGVFHKTRGRPTFIILDSHIGYGSPHKQDTAAADGEPLGEEEVRLTKPGLWVARGGFVLAAIGLAVAAALVFGSFTHRLRRR